MTRDDGTRRTRAMVAACEGISTEALEARAVAKVVEALEAYVNITENPAPRADDRKMQWLSVSLKARAALALIKGEQQ